MKSLKRGLCAAVSALCCAAAQSQTYTAIDLGPATWASGLNSSGQVVGVLTSASGVRQAFLTGSNATGLTLLGTLGGSESIAAAVNDLGQVVGSSETVTGSTRAFITGANGSGMTSLGTLGGAYSMAWGVNNSGQVVGESATGTQVNAYYTGVNGSGMTPLGTLGNPSVNNPNYFGVDSSFGRGINDNGLVTGYSENNLGNVAFIAQTNGSGLTAISASGFFARARGLNNSGQVIGYTWSGPSNDDHAFISGPNGTGGLTDLGTLGGNYSYALGVNATGWVVGSSATLAGEYHAFIASTSSPMQDLNTLVNLESVVLYDARGINASGQIIANGSNSHAYLLTLSPVPEPKSYALALAGLIAIGWVIRRRSPTLTS